jgi:hypothetical protein
LEPASIHRRRSGHVPGLLDLLRKALLYNLTYRRRPRGGRLVFFLAAGDFSLILISGMAQRSQEIAISEAKPSLMTMRASCRARPAYPPCDLGTRTAKHSGIAKGLPPRESSGRRYAAHAYAAFEATAERLAIEIGKTSLTNREVFPDYVAHKARERSIECYRGLTRGNGAHDGSAMRATTRGAHGYGFCHSFPAGSIALAATAPSAAALVT